jgi:hypothetical protein
MGAGQLPSRPALPQFVDRLFDPRLLQAGCSGGDRRNLAGSHRTSVPSLGRRGMLERVMGIEPTLVAWEATVLPLNYTRFAVRFYAAARPTGKLTLL